MKQLDRILVLGASSDIGMELLRELDGQVGQILAHANQNLARLQAYAQGSASQVRPLQADLSDPAQVQALLAELEGEGLPQAVIHLAAPRLRMLRFKDATDADFRSELEAQVLGPQALLASLCPRMAKAGPGKLIFLLSSVTLDEVPAGLAPYTVAKYALLGLMRSLAAEYGPKGLSASALSPGMVDTAFLQHLHPSVVERAAEASPRGRNATAGEVAKKLGAMLLGAENLNGKNLNLEG
jgi:3-oxoacyl-[acyl-carrier protein] reductase